jgi:hypothetical protein
VDSRLTREDFRPAAGRLSEGLAGLVDLESRPASVRVASRIICPREKESRIMDGTNLSRKTPVERNRFAVET